MLPDHPIERFLPPVLLQPGPREVLWWQWIALPGVLAAAWVFGLGLGKVTMTLALRLARKTKPTWDDELVVRLGAPVTLAWTAVAAQALMALLVLAPIADLFVSRVL